MKHTRHAPALVPLCLFVASVSLLGCKPQSGYHPHSDVPENHAEVHKPEYRGGEIDHGELDPVDPQDDVVHGEPPARVGAAWSDPDGEFRITAVVLDAGIKDACNIEMVEAYFEYDSAKLSSEARQAFADIADCFSADGPLAGHELEVVGHTDPRGSDSYNRELGKDRATSVADVLLDNGMREAQLEVESRGESTAHLDPDVWPKDRRVELHISSS